MSAKSITFDRFDMGIDLRKGASVADANRLREMKNAYVTTGLATQKRPGLIKVATLEPGTKGLFAAFGKLNTFSGGAVTHANALFNCYKLEFENRAIKQVWFADVFNAHVYASVEYENGVVKHHYTDNGATLISDANCPHSKAAIKADSKIFATKGEVVRFSKTNAPRDWTTANDAGFLPTGLQFRGDREANALGIYQNNLVVLSRDSAQIWNTDPDPTAMSLIDQVYNVGTSYPRTVTNVGGDLYFLSDYGFRSITTLQYTNNLADVDIGSPIDVLVRNEIKTNSNVPMSYYYYGTGQYLCMIGNRIFVYSISRTSKIAAWSRYELPINADAFAELNGQLYIRSGDDVYRLSEEASDDNGQAYEVLLELPYMDLKAPGQLKRILGTDIVMDGECYFSVAYDVRNPRAVTPAVKVKGNTRPNGVVPVECAGTEFSLRFRNMSKKPFRLDAVTIYYESMGAI